MNMSLLEEKKQSTVSKGKVMIKPPFIKKEETDCLTEFVNGLGKSSSSRKRKNYHDMEQRPINIGFCSSSDSDSSSEEEAEVKKPLKKIIKSSDEKVIKNRQRKLSTLKTKVKKILCDPSSKINVMELASNDELLANTLLFIITYGNYVIARDLKKSKQLINFMWLTLLLPGFNEWVHAQANTSWLVSTTAKKKEKSKIVNDYLEDLGRKNEVKRFIEMNSTVLRFIILKIYLEIYYERDDGDRAVHFSIENFVKLYGAQFGITYKEFNI